MKNWILILCISLILIACHTTYQRANFSEKVVEPFRMEFMIIEDDELQFQISLENNSDENVTLQFLSSQLFEITVKHQESGKVVYRYSDEQMFSQAIVTETLDVNETLTFEDVWNKKVNGERLQAGTYAVTAQLLIWKANDEEVNSETFTITKEIIEK